jgi:hypothetical protein
MSTAMNNSIAATICSTSSIPYPSLFGAEFLSLETTLVQNYSRSIHAGLYSNHGAVNVVDATFCNVTVSYTHPGQNDTIFVQVWLPAPADTWNGRLQMVGGAGWQGGLTYAAIAGMTAAIGEGYATISTDAGLGSQATPEEWALLSPGNVNLYLLQDLTATSLNDASIIGKSISNSFYGQPPVYSYFTGCSQGGRQGMMLAQRFPDAFDGIAASAPAINWNNFFIADFWPRFVMNELGEFPPSCEFDAITAAVLSTCDGNDGLVDGIITDPNSCTFDVMSMVGQTINCTNFGTTRQISLAAANIIEATVSQVMFYFPASCE